jgi:AAA+ ATPase superfamily predicted ATPase
MHDMLVEKLLMLERLLLKHDYQELLIRTYAIQSHEKALRLVRLKEEQIKLLDDLLREYAHLRRVTNWHPYEQFNDPEI